MSPTVEPGPSGARLAPRWEGRAARLRPYALAALALAAVVAGLRALVLYYGHPLTPVDGAFQTYNAVRAFAEGQALGVEFQSYLGVGMPLALLPTFLLFGETPFAATASAVLLVQLGALATLLVLVRLAGFRDRWAAVLVACGALALLNATSSFRYSELLVAPGHSLRPARWALPFLIAWPVYRLFRACLAQVHAGRAGWGPAAGLGVAGGLATVWAHDIGIPTLIGLFGALLLAVAPRAAFRHTALAALAYGLGAGTVGALALLLLTHGRPEEWLVYTFSAVRVDQYWLFSPWGDGDRIDSPWHLTRLFRGSRIVRTTLALTLVWLTVAAVRLLRRHGPPARQATTVAVLASTVGGAILPQVGGHVDWFYAAGTILPGVAAPFALFGPRLVKLARGLAARVALRPLTAGLALALGVVANAVWGWQVARAAGSGATVYNATMGAHVLRPEQASLGVFERLGRAMDSAGVAPAARLLSDYYAAPNIAAGATPPTPYPAVIHALGAEARARFAGALTALRPPVVATVHPWYDGWAEWNLRSSWYWYRAVLARYEPVARTEQHLVWVPRREALPPPTALSCVVVPAPNGAVEVVVGGGPGRPKGENWLAEVQLRLSTGAAVRGRHFWAVDEIDTPLTRRAGSVVWWGWPRYGAPPGLEQTLVTEVDDVRPARLRLSVVPGERAPARTEGACRATAVFPNPHVRDVPALRDVRTLWPPRSGTGAAR